MEKIDFLVKVGGKSKDNHLYGSGRRTYRKFSLAKWVVKSTGEQKEAYLGWSAYHNAEMDKAIRMVEADAFRYEWQIVEDRERVESYGVKLPEPVVITEWK